MKKFIFFRNDRLGDFLILTSILKSIKEKYKDSHITVVCSPLNHILVKKYKIINQIYIHSKKNSFFKTLSLLLKICKSNYYASCYSS